MAELNLDLSIPDVIPSHLPVLALRRGVLLPGGVLPLTVGRATSLAAVRAAKGGLLLVAAQREAVEDPGPSDLLPTATLARVVARKPLRDGVEQVVVQGLARVSFTGFTSLRPHLEAAFSRLHTPWPDTAAGDGLAAELRRTIEETAKTLNFEPQAQAVLQAAQDPGLLADCVAAFLERDEDWKKALLATTDPVVRAERVLTELVRMREALAAQKAVQERVNDETKDMQREFFLRRQLDAIKKELGEGGADDDLGRLRERLAAAELPDEVREVVDRELRRLERISEQSPERAVAMDWLEWVADMPWGEHTAVDPDLGALETALERSHYGLDDVKRQVVEHLAVRKMAGSGRAEVLLLLGPPGVGKTSIGQAIADATGRKLVRVALGGMRDEAELRGHRRTYIGARPGRLVEGLRRAGTSDPVILLDEIDKLGTGWQGDPAAALLEILDPEQNHHFVDRYLEVPVDLSRALFVATANDLSGVPAPLRDRMQLLSLDGYTREEKRTIARNHLIPVVSAQTGLTPEAVSWTDEVLDALIAGWTREAGVRELQRVLAKAYRAAAVKRARGEEQAVVRPELGRLDEIFGRQRFFDDQHEAVARTGIVTGLAWTPVGGDVLYVEASTLPGAGRLVLTGQLGDVMKESARAALTYVLAHAEELGIPLDAADGKDVHVHVPAGGTPKDGPSAGVTMFTALASLLSGRKARADTAMTGEATLRGRVLPVGGIPSKVLAAHRVGIRRVILPRRNGLDVAELPREIREEMTFILVDHMSEVLEAALEPPASAEAKADEAAA